MKKSLLAVAVAAALPTLAQAQVTLFGVFDLGYRSYDGTVKMASGQWAGARVGVRGSSDVGSGLKANFHVESAIDYLGAGSSWGTTRGAFGGLSGGFGRVDLGSRILSPTFQATAALDPTGQAGIALSPYGGIGARIDKAVYYTSNSISGLVVRAAMTQGDDVVRAASGSGSTAVTAWPNKSMFDASAVYTAGPLTVAAAFGDTGSTDGFMVGAGYDLKVANVRVRYVDSTINNQVYPSSNSSSVASNTSTQTLSLPRIAPEAILVGATIPFGPGYVFVDYLKDQKNTGAVDEALLGVSYDLNKATQGYAYFKRVDASGNRTEENIVGVGLRHAF